MRNNTSGFDFSDENSYSARWGLRLLGERGNFFGGNFNYHEYASLMVFFSRDERVYENKSAGISFGNPGFGPVPNSKMTANSWGPVIFAIALPQAFTPKSPDGEPALDDCYFMLGDNKFVVGKTYATNDATQEGLSSINGFIAGMDMNTSHPFIESVSDGIPTGLDPDLYNALVAHLNPETTGIIEIDDWASWQVGLDTGAYDAVISAVDITEDRQELVDFTDPYLEYGGMQYAIAVRKNNTELLNALNSALESLKSSGELDALIQKYIP